MYFKAVLFLLLELFLSGIRLRAQPTSLSARVLSDGWPVRAFVLNNLGTVAVAGGYNPFSTDRLVLVTSTESVTLAAAGDPVPGFEDKIFIGFLSNLDSLRPLVLNDRDEVAFTGAFMDRIDCMDVSDVSRCLESGKPFRYGLFLYSKGVISKVIASREQMPDAAGRTFWSTYQVWLNNAGDILFNAWMEGPERTYSPGLFMFSSGRLLKVAFQGDPTPLAVPLALDTDQFTIVFNDEGAVTFAGISGGVFHFSNGTFIKDLAVGDPAPGGGIFQSIFEVASNGQGDLAFHALFGNNPWDQGLFLRRRDGSMVRIVADGDPTPLGGTFSLWYEYWTYGRSLAKSIACIRFSPVLNRSGDLVFSAAINEGAATGALFLYSADGIKTIAADGDAAPPESNANFVLFQPAYGSPPLPNSLAYTINDFDTLAFASELTTGALGLFQFVEGTITRIAAPGDPAPGTDHSLFASNLSRPPYVRPTVLQNDRGDVVFWSGLCCDRFTEGIFLSASPGSIYTQRRVLVAEKQP